MSTEKRAEPEMLAALELAYRHIIAHHEVTRQMKLGQPCPVCCHADGSEPELNSIAKVIAKAKGQT